MRRMDERGNESAAGISSRQERGKGAAGKMNERGRGAKQAAKQQAHYCYIRTMKYITRDFTAALLPREHRRPPVLLPGATSGHHLRNAIDDLSAKPHVMLRSVSPSPPPFLLPRARSPAPCAPRVGFAEVRGGPGSHPALRHSKEIERSRKASYAANRGDNRL